MKHNSNQTMTGPVKVNQERVLQTLLVVSLFVVTK